jgi:hypothetical protein
MLRKLKIWIKSWLKQRKINKDAYDDWYPDNDIF